ncbi:hypothetical protein J2Z83_003791 [Virgibacillus natechei]|uniref:DUF4825 domain-containing protein n=1 Tax=Virgibacillus natechei TaxID=1216297 RepID=A0ABS4IL50_9BACI|nr:hypothetical protein [Virgibacillus natechei]MBP1971640.1 hypothetical protein [Virgibacillus natechei]UZD13034.1 hypothetical protein OLD84_00195 [Virgibacillus natechei]
MKKIPFIMIMFITLIGCSESEAREGIPIEEIEENWEVGHINHDLELGDFNDENLARIGEEPNLLMGVDDPENVTQVQIISRNGHTSDHLDKMISLMGTLIVTLDDDMTMSIDDIGYIEDWLINNENKDMNDHSYRVDGDINDTHYIYANINSNKE